MSAEPLSIHAAATPYEPFQPDSFTRKDESDDRKFYERDRLVSHLDSTALATVEEIIGKLVVEENPVILDLMASWDSHIPNELRSSKVTGLGMNMNELLRNESLRERLVHDLNADPRLPFEDASFDVVLNTVSVDYMARPFEIFTEVGRVLKPGGLFLVLFSNRMFPDKAVKIWVESSEAERVELVRLFFRNSGHFEEPEVFASIGKPRHSGDKYAYLGIPSDPIYAVYAERLGGKVRSKRPRLIEQDSKVSGKMDGRPVRESLLCPHCGERMKKWAVPNHPFSTWDTDFLYICFNDACSYVVGSWKALARQGNPGVSCRFVYDPIRDSAIAMPIVNLNALREGIVDE
ncbi:MAG: methyltransferase domain-containing protein [Syntrophobacteraceae bacterium]